MQLEETTAFQKEINMNRLPFLNVIDNVTPCTKVTKYFDHFLNIPLKI